MDSYNANNNIILCIVTALMDKHTTQWKTYVIATLILLSVLHNHKKKHADLQVVN